jgi:ssDNA-binding Zn-finger/Zn-ribbon topoisomerase 1
MLSVQLDCDGCGWRTLCGEGEILRRLRIVGQFRRATDPPEEMVREVLLAHGGALACDECMAAGLRVTLDPSQDDGDEWEQAIVCEICREPIPAERLEYLPGATRCVKCQDAADRGRAFVEPEYCPKCGSLLELRVSRGGGITRYKLWCTGSPACRL